MLPARFFAVKTVPNMVAREALKAGAIPAVISSFERTRFTKRLRFTFRLQFFVQSRELH